MFGNFSVLTSVPMTKTTVKQKLVLERMIDMSVLYSLGISNKEPCHKKVRKESP